MAAIFAPQPPGESFGGGRLWGGIGAAAPEDISVDANGSSASSGSPPVFVFGQAAPSEASGPSVSRPPAKKERAPIGGKLRKAAAASGPAAKAADAAASAWQQPPVPPRPEQQQQQPPVAEGPKPAPQMQPPPLFQFGGSSASSSPPPPPQETTASNPFCDASNPFGGDSSSYFGAGSSTAASSSSPFVFGIASAAAPPAGTQIFSNGVNVKKTGARSSRKAWAGDSETADSWTGMQSKKAEDAMQQASGHVAGKRYGEAMQALLPAFDGDSAALELARQCVASWLKSERQLVVDHDGEKARLQVQLNAARDRLDDLRLRKDQELAKERRLRIEAEQKVAGLQHRIQGQHEVLQENCRLRQQLQRAEAKGRGPPSREDVVKELAKLECRPLKDCHADSERAALKKKLLLKWHPDKQPSPQNTAFATQIMQELQNCREWSL
eukprot:TRINITY_DN80488_c0_g1_i1.p1 TRINITY_DN80488_c0_g1~~TRINITY_DN80488_c0_g1_i1.p1  ORF type:complete len:440 (+),score=129.04 TRINITY_DN80488_c0_g1_i1:126-1445(+)